MTLVQLLAYGFVAMTTVAAAAIAYGFKLQYKINQMESQEYREQVCREVLIENRKKEGFS